MAYDIQGESITLKAPSTAFSTYQYRFVVASSSEGFFKAGSSVAQNYPTGILQDAPTVTGQPCRIQVTGVSKYRSSTAGTINPGAHVISGLLGGVISTGAVGNDALVYGPTLTATAGSSHIGTVVLNRFAYSSSD